MKNKRSKAMPDFYALKKAPTNGSFTEICLLSHTKGVFTLGVRDSSVESIITILVIYDLNFYLLL
jgi:hypothetical protein